jgi:peroxiredoxin
MRICATLLGFLLFGSLAFGATLQEGSRAEQFTLKVVNTDKVDKRQFSLANYVGEAPSSAKKVVVLSFFATYCEPCKRELPQLQKLYERYADQGLGVLVVSIDKDRDVKGGAAAAVQVIAQENKLTFPVLHDRFNIVAKRYGVEKLPCLYLIDANGNVARANVGYTDDFSVQLTTEIQQRLGVPIEALDGTHSAAQEPKKAKGKPKKKLTTK